MFDKFKEWYVKSYWLIRIPVSIVLASLILAVVLFGLWFALMLFIFWPIQLIGWWVICYWIVLVIAVGLEIARQEDLTQKRKKQEEQEKLLKRAKLRD